VQVYAAAAPNTPLAAATAVGLTGGGLPHNNMMPYLTLNFCIALQGIYPARP
jgi:microcystin-dependent protein